MNTSIFPVILATMAVIGGSLLVLRRFPNRRLRLLTLTIGWMALAQFAYVMHPEDAWATDDRDLSRAHYILMGGLSFLALYFLGTEMLDRKLSKASAVASHRDSVNENAPGLDIRSWLVNPETLMNLQTRQTANWNIDIAEKQPIGRFVPAGVLHASKS